MRYFLGVDLGTTKTHTFITDETGAALDFGESGPGNFETVVVAPSLRSAFVQNLKAFVDEYQLDGADIDWEYPDAGTSAHNFLH